MGFGSAIIGLIALYYIFVKFPLSFSMFANFNIYLLILWMFMTFLIFICHSWRWKVVMESHKIYIKFYRIFLYKLVGSGVSYFTPAAKVGGEPVRALLVKRHGYDLKTSLSSVVVDKSIELASQLVFFAIGVVLILLTIVLPDSVRVILIVAGILALFIVFYYYKSVFNKQFLFVKIFRKLNLHNIRRMKKYEQKLHDFEKLMINYYINNKKSFALAVLITAISWMIMFAEFKLATMLLGISVSWGHIFLIFSLVGIAYIIPVPMSLGSLEAGQVGIFKILKLNAQGGLALSLLIRARDLLWSIFGLITLTYFGFSIRKTLEEDTRLDEEIEKIR